MKKEVLGAYDFRFDDKNEVLIVKWVDNKNVTIGTNYNKIEPTCNIECWYKCGKRKASVVQPEVLNTYNTSMRGVDKHE